MRLDAPWPERENLGDPRGESGRPSGCVSFLMFKRRGAWSPNDPCETPHSDAVGFCLSMTSPTTCRITLRRSTSTVALQRPAARASMAALGTRLW